MLKRRSAGEIVAIGGMKNVTTGDTICDENKPIILESMEFPDPVVRVAVEPKTRADQDKMGIALNRLAQEDPSFQVSTDHETGQTIIAGMGELHLEIIVDRMKREFGVEANVGKPQVAYRETITQPAPGKEIFKKQTGGRGQFGHVELEIEPAPGEGFVFEDKITGGAIPREFIKPDREGISDAMGRGFLAGYELVDIKVRLVFGSYHEVDSDERSFHIAGSLAFQDAVKKAKPVLLEPIMRVEVVTPEEYMGAVNGDLIVVAARSRRWSRVRAMFRSSRHLCRCRRCSVTRPICARRRRDARLRRCTLSVTTRRRGTSPKRSSPKLRASLNSYKDEMR